MKNFGRSAAVLLVTSLALGACGSEPGAGELKPGNWKMSAGMVDMDVPGATPEQQEMFKSSMGEMMSQEQCVTAQEAKFDPDTMAEAFKQGGDCTIGNFDLTGGNIDGKMTCKVPDAGDIDIAITGNIGPEKFSMKATTEMVQDALPEGKANVTMEVTGERIGDC